MQLRIGLMYLRYLDAVLIGQVGVAAWQEWSLLRTQIVMMVWMHSEAVYGKKSYVRVRTIMYLRFRRLRSGCIIMHILLARNAILEPTWFLHITCSST